MGRQAPFGESPRPPARSAAALRFAALASDARAWCSGRSWTWRAALLAYLAWVGWRHLRDPEYASLFGGITLGIHELGHVLLGWAGPFLSIAGGSLAQVAVPAAAAWLLFRQRDYFGVAVGAAWEAFSLWNLATYVGDARARALPLVGLTADPVHDWNFLLGRLGILGWDRALAFVTRSAALAIWIAALALGAWLCWTMSRSRKASASPAGS